MTDALRVRRSLRITGVVQGVGFRPFVYSLATSLGLGGHVGNDPSGVFLDVEGPEPAVQEFLDRMHAELPVLASIESMRERPAPPLGDTAFRIVESRHAATDIVALIPPDTASCADCTREVLDPADRRHRYPFTACTYCGPRYTLVTGLPYDRPFTTMAEFPLCDLCAAEYADPADRRFHAQPTACPVCGPRLAFRRGDVAEVSSYADDALADALRVLHAGGIVAVKGLGGYHLACDAYDTAAVEELRRRKQRGSKPFAVMVRDLATAEGLVVLDDAARAALVSPRAPIVLAPTRSDASAADVELASASAPDVGTLGVLLPYSPLHLLLFTAHPSLPGVEPPRALVMTSGNLSDEPLCTEPAEADERLSALADAFLHHDRPIHTACDDSVVRIVGETLQPVRRSRGFAPLPVRLPLDAPATLAVGGELKTAVCLATGRRAWMSQHVGDTENLETLAMLTRVVLTLAELTRVEPESVVADAHPAYLSRRWALDHAEAMRIEAVLVQHHHAHLASLLAEHQVEPGEEVLGFVFDGTGFGTDGTIWGGELLLGSYADVTRVGHLRPVSLPGGDAAVRRPARTAMAHLEAAGIDWDEGIPSIAAADSTERSLIASMLRSGAGCTPTTSMGRLFDAVASILGVRQDVDHEGQAAMELEALAARSVGADLDGWAFDLDDDGEGLVLDPSPVVRDAVASVRDGVDARLAARAFHAAVAGAVDAAARRVRETHGTGVVGLTGGVFQNARLSEDCRGRLERQGFRVLVHELVPPNDGGLALGQVAVAAAGGGERRPSTTSPSERPMMF